MLVQVILSPLSPQKKYMKVLSHSRTPFWGLLQILDQYKKIQAYQPKTNGRFNLKKKQLW